MVTSGGTEDRECTGNRPLLSHRQMDGAVNETSTSAEYLLRNVCSSRRESSFFGTGTVRTLVESQQETISLD